MKTQTNPRAADSAQHTPGPWEYVPKITASENHKGFFVRAQKATRDGKWSLADVQSSDEDGKIGEANARLIAAAPELLRAAVAALTIVNREQPDGSIAHDLRAAIAKAGGRA